MHLQAIVKNSCKGKTYPSIRITSVQTLDCTQNTFIFK